MSTTTAPAAEARTARTAGARGASAFTAENTPAGAWKEMT